MLYFKVRVERPLVQILQYMIKPSGTFITARVMDDYFILQDLKQMVENIVGEQSSNCLQSVIIYIAS